MVAEQLVENNKGPKRGKATGVMSGKCPGNSQSLPAILDEKGRTKLSGKGPNHAQDDQLVSTD